MALIPSLDPRRSVPLAWRIFIVNSALLSIATIVLAVSPATVSFPIALAEAIVLTLGLIAILGVNLVLVRRAFTPLDRLTKLMQSVDLLNPGQRVEVTGPEEVRELGAVFNEMLERLERERQESSWDAVKKQEAERKRVARELHDEIGQALTAVLIQLGRLVRKAPDELKPELNEAAETTRASLDDVRRVARHLRPEALDDLGLVPALNVLAATFAERTGIRIRRHFPERVPAIADEAELVVFRVAQESLTNAARHAGSDGVDLSLELRGPQLVLTVRDYGRGINGALPGSGIRGMRERALLIGADLSLGSPPGGGTEVRLALSYDAA